MERIDNMLSLLMLMDQINNKTIAADAVHQSELGHTHLENKVLPPALSESSVIPFSRLCAVHCFDIRLQMDNEEMKCRVIIGGEIYSTI